MRFVRRAVVASMQRMQSHLPAVQSALRRGRTLSESAGPGVWVGTPLARPSVLLAMVAPLWSAAASDFPEDSYTWLRDLGQKISGFFRCAIYNILVDRTGMGQ